VLLALVDHITPRHEYIFEFLFRDILGIQLKLTANPDEYSQYDGPKFSYTEKAPAGLNFLPSTLLSEEGLHLTTVEVIDYEGKAMFFPVKEGGALPFDPFAMAFFILTRMEEYLPFKADMHGRFTEKNSLQFQHGYLGEPIVNKLAFLILEKIRKEFPDLQAKTNYSFIPTIDVDIAYAHLAKDTLRALGGYAKLLLKRDFSSLKERRMTLKKELQDPYDNFDLHLGLAAKYKTELIYFLLLGDYGKYDKMVSYKNALFRDLIKKLNEKADVGIHPSYASFGNFDQLKNEIKRLEDITGEKTEKHRAHFLRMRFPDTYRKLSELGITDDFSLGYSGINGFRAGTAVSFYFYDLLKEEKTSLRLHPFIFMDSAMIDNMHLTPEQAEEEVKNLLDKVKKAGGEAIGIWHNYSLSEKGQYRGWQAVFRRTIEYATQATQE